MVSVTFLSLFGSFTLFTNVLANVFMTNPTASTTCQGGKSCSIAWMDDGKAPNLQQFGNASIGIWVGSVTSQTQLQPIQSSVNVATTAAVQFTVDPSIGPNGNDYFIRITSQSFQDPNAAGAFEEAFSAKIHLVWDDWYFQLDYPTRDQRCFLRSNSHPFSSRFQFRRAKQRILESFERSFKQNKQHRQRKRCEQDWRCRLYLRQGFLSEPCGRCPYFRFRAVRRSIQIIKSHSSG